jgi:hypothetical protein
MLKAVDHAGAVYAVGGVQGDQQPFLATVERYDPDTDMWSAVAPMSTGRGNRSVVVVAVRLTSRDRSEMACEPAGIMRRTALSAPPAAEDAGDMAHENDELREGSYVDHDGQHLDSRQGSYVDARGHHHGTAPPGRYIDSNGRHVPVEHPGRYVEAEHGSTGGQAGPA